VRPLRWCVVGAVILLCLVSVGSSFGSSPLTLTERVLPFAGMKPSSPPRVIRNVAAFESGEPSTDAKFRALGFVAGVAEQLTTPGNQNRFGLSLVVQLSSAENAKTALKYDYTSNGPFTLFTVTGIPGAVGFEGSDGGEGGRNIGFTLGPYFYVVGAGWQNGATNAIPRSTLQVAALFLYRHVS
jgi:hypothetical protein